jgi:hypothetical protein
VMLALAATPVVMLRQMAKRLLRSGYGHPDLVRAMRDELEERRGVMESTYGSGTTRMDRWLERLLWGGLATETVALGWMILGPWFPGSGLLLGVLLPVSQVTWLAAGIGSAVRHQMRGHLPGKNWLKFWESRLGRAIFHGAEKGLGVLPAGMPYGPTELAIGMAAGRLFESLPTLQREAFSDLPEVVRRLEVDAERMRASIRELDTLVGQTSEAGPGQRALGPEGGSAVMAELKQARVAAEERLSQVVAALETIRVELLRLHAGAASVESVTQDLSAARELVEDVARLQAARREVERMLGRRTPGGLTPVPTPG